MAAANHTEMKVYAALTKTSEDSTAIKLNLLGG